MPNGPRRSWRPPWGSIVAEPRRRPTTLPAGYHRRGWTADEAATYAGVDRDTFLAMVRQGVMPAALPGYPPEQSRWDIRALDAALDRLSGLVEPSKADWEALARSRINEGRGEVRHLPSKR